MVVVVVVVAVVMEEEEVEDVEAADVSIVVLWILLSSQRVRYSSRFRNDAISGCCPWGG